MPTNLKIVDAARNAVLARSTFKGYDACVNPYVGRQFGCSYCYVRFFVKDEEKNWGEFVRVRKHLADKLPKELAKLKEPTRVVIGTMTDPYQPQERKARLTRKALELLAGSDMVSKVGIFTRSPIVEEDAALIAKLPRARVHLSITPFPREAMALVEKIPVLTRRRWSVARALADAGVRVHVNVAPAIPILSDQDGLVEEYCKAIVSSGVSEFFVDPVQPYAESVTAMKEGLQADPRWKDVEATLLDKKAFSDWKEGYRVQWKKAWDAHGSGKVLAIWSDHINKVYQDMATGEELNHRTYDMADGR